MEDSSDRLSELGESLLSDLPANVAENLPTISSRLNSFLTFYSALNLNRLQTLSQFVERAERILFDVNSIDNMDSEQLMATYKQAKVAMVEVLEMARKVSVQCTAEENSRVDEVYQSLKNLSPSTLMELKSKIDELG